MVSIKYCLKFTTFSRFCLAEKYVLQDVLVVFRTVTIAAKIVLQYGNAFLALVITPAYDIIMLAKRDHEPIRGQNFETSIWKNHDKNCSCLIELQLVCIGQRAAATNGLLIQQKALSFFTQSDHLERGNRKIEILYLEAKLQLKPATVSFALLPRFLRLSSWLYTIWLLLSSLTEKLKTVAIPCD